MTAKRQWMEHAFVVGLMAFALASCTAEPKQEEAPGGAARAEVPAHGAPHSQPQAQQPPAQSATSKVLETMDSGGYTYAKLEIEGKPVWVAGPKTELAVGDQVEMTQGTEMRGFQSPSLNRTFDVIYFVSSWGEKHANANAGAAAATGDGVASGTDLIEPAEGGVTVAGLFADKANLVGKPVVVRGKVVKFNPSIMGRNWLHLQDGTGAAGTNDITVTTQAAANVGDIVVVRGTLIADKDFGAGYKYDLLIEDAAITGK